MAPNVVTTVYGVPPEMLRLICCGDEAAQAGKFVIGLGANEVLGLLPFARRGGMDGLEVVTKISHIPINSELAGHSGMEQGYYFACE